MSNIVARHYASSLDRSIVETLAYFDVFDFPVREEELHRYLHGLRAPVTDLRNALRSLEASGEIASQDGFYVLAGREFLIDSYETAALQNARRLHLALRYGQALARLPFIRLVAVTGSVAMQNGGPGADFDYLLVTQQGRLWLGRALAVALGRWTSLHGHTICPNIILSERNLLWPQQDLYAAHELTQMIPVSGFRIYRHLRELNHWTRAYLPNADGAPSSSTADQPVPSPWQRLVEPALRLGLSAALERFEMHRKIARFRHQPGFGEETFFSADVCQGNFQHHGGFTRQAFERRLAALGLASSGHVAWTQALIYSAPTAPPLADSRRPGAPALSAHHQSSAPAIANE